MRLVITAAALALLAAPADAGVFGLGFGGEYGNAYLPPTAGSMGVTAIHYREVGGPIGNLILLAGVTPVKPGVSTTVSQEYECTGTGAARSCLEFTTTTTTYPSEAEMAAYDKAVKDFDPRVAEAIMSGSLGQEVDMTFASRSLGGSASGFMFSMWRAVPGVPPNITFGQFAFGWLTFHDVHSRTVNATGGELRSMEKVSDFTYKYVGFIPVRFSAPIGKTGFGVQVQLDMNALAVVMDQPSPIRANLQWVGYHAIVSVGGMVSGFRPDGASLTAEAQVAF